MIVGVRYLEPRQHRDHGHVALFWIGKRFLSIEIDPDGDVVVLYSNRYPTGGLTKVWVFE